MSLVEQELPTLPEHLSSPPGFSGVHVTRSLVLYVCFVDHCLSFCLFSFDHCVVCSSSIYGFWLTLWYLQALLTIPFDRFVWFRWYIYPYATRVILCNYTHFILNLNRNSFYLYKKYYTIIVFGLIRPEHEPMSTRTLTFTPLSNCRYCCFVILSLMQTICDT